MEKDIKKIEKEKLEKVAGGAVEKYAEVYTYKDLDVVPNPGQSPDFHPAVIIMGGHDEYYFRCKLFAGDGPKICFCCTNLHKVGKNYSGSIGICKARSREYDPGLE